MLLVHLRLLRKNRAEASYEDVMMGIVISVDCIVISVLLLMGLMILYKIMLGSMDEWLEKFIIGGISYSLSVSLLDDMLFAFVWFLISLRPRVVKVRIAVETFCGVDSLAREEFGRYLLE